jgi:catabolite regulation protein CreA
MPQSMLDYVVDALNATKREDEVVAKATGISKWTLRKIRIREIDNPGVKTVEPLYHYFKLREVKQRRNGQWKVA